MAAYEPVRGAIPAAPTSFYTCPSGKKALVTNLAAVNKVGSTRTLTLDIGGQSYASALSIAANAIVQLVPEGGFLILNPGESLVASGSVNNDLVLQGSVREIDFEAGTSAPPAGTALKPIVIYLTDSMFDAAGIFVVPPSAAYNTIYVLKEPLARTLTINFADTVFGQHVQRLYSIRRLAPADATRTVVITGVDGGPYALNEVNSSADIYADPVSVKFVLADYRVGGQGVAGPVVDPNYTTLKIVSNGHVFGPDDYNKHLIYNGAASAKGYMPSQLSVPEGKSATIYFTNVGDGTFDIDPTAVLIAIQSSKLLTFVKDQTATSPFDVHEFTYNMPSPVTYDTGVYPAMLMIGMGQSNNTVTDRLPVVTFGGTPVPIIAKRGNAAKTHPFIWVGVLPGYLGGNGVGNINFQDTDAVFSSVVHVVPVLGVHQTTPLLISAGADYGQAVYTATATANFTMDTLALILATGSDYRGYNGTTQPNSSIGSALARGYSKNADFFNDFAYYFGAANVITGSRSATVTFDNAATNHRGGNLLMVGLRPAAVGGGTMIPTDPTAVSKGQALRIEVLPGNVVVAPVV